MKPVLKTLKSTIFQQIPAPAITINSAGQIMDINPLAKTLIKDLSIKLNNTKSVYSLIEKKDTRKLNTFLRELSDEGYSKAHLQLNTGRKSTWTEITAKKFFIDTEKMGLLQFRDITDELESQHRLRLQYEISKSIIVSHNLQDTLYKIIKVITDNSKWFCGVAWVTNEQNALEYSCSAFPKSLLKSTFISKTIKGEINEGSLAYRVLRAQEQRWVPDFRKIKGARQIGAKELGIKSAYAFPIMHEGKVFAIFEFFSLRTEFPDKELYNLTYFINNQLESYLKRRYNEVRIAQSEERYRALVELAPDIIFSIDNNGCVISLNEAYERITKIPRENLIGQSFIEIVHADDVEQATQFLKTNIKKTKAHSFTARLKTAKEDAMIVGEIRLRNKLGIIVDLTDHYHLEKQKDLWFGVATHELKTPLTSIKAFSQLLLLDEKIKNRDYLENINEQVNRMTDLINDLLDITRITNETFEIVKNSHDINELVSKVVSMLQPLSKHQIKMELCEDCVTQVDPKRISQVITNLVGNAIKYSPEADKIEIKTQLTDDNYILVSVKDYGFGVAKTELSKIFNLFYRSHTKHAHKTPGLGIGLYISKTIIKLHGGKIWADSKIGEGSTFYFSVPIIKQQ